MVSLDDDYVPEKKGDISWLHLTPSEKVIDAIIHEFGQDEEFQEDLLEEQRPRLANFKKFSVVVFSAPTPKGLKQLSFIVSKDKLISVSSSKPGIIDGVMDEIIAEGQRFTPTSVLSGILAEAVEQSIALLDEQEKAIDSFEINILKNEKLDQMKMQNLRVELFYNSKMLRADLEVVREIVAGESRFISKKEFDSHIEDRLLFGIDTVETLKESVTNIYNMHLANLSHKMNESMHKLTVIGSILLIPAVVASIFGMNVALPNLTFWEIILGSLALSAVLWVVLKKIRWV